MLFLAVELTALKVVADIVGGAPLGASAPIDMNILQLGRVLRGIHQVDSIPHIFIPKLLKRNRSVHFPIDRIVRTYAFADINQAFADAASGTVIKPVLMMDH
jgi:aryl-alcohol dehydrogenase